MYGPSAQVPAGNSGGVYQGDYVDMELGMNPKLVGKGNGYEFCAFIMHFVKEKHNNKPLRLIVATFNRRGIHLYEMSTVGTDVNTNHLSTGIFATEVCPNVCRRRIDFTVSFQEGVFWVFGIGPNIRMLNYHIRKATDDLNTPHLNGHLRRHQTANHR